MDDSNLSILLRWFRICFLSSLFITISFPMISCQGQLSQTVTTPQYVPVVVAGEEPDNDAYPGSSSPTTVPPPMVTAIPTVAPTETETVTVLETPATALPSPTMNGTPISPTEEVAMTATITPTLLAGSTPTPSPTISNPAFSILGYSVEGRPIEAYRFNDASNDGGREIVIVGGIHGGYEWNSILLAYELLDHFVTNPELIPDSTSLTIIPSANPDGQALVTGTAGRFSAADVAENSFPGRFNANQVDLNRNWDCQWQPVATWRDQPVSGGTEPFSEPESVVLRDYFLDRRPAAVIFLHSAANGVFAAGCPDTHLESMLLAQTYGEASGYAVHERFSSYPITGDAGDWLALQDIPAMTVELIDHYATEFSRNLAGMLAVIEQYG